MGSVPGYGKLTGDSPPPLPGLVTCTEEKFAPPLPLLSHCNAVEASGHLVSTPTSARRKKGRGCLWQDTYHHVDGVAEIKKMSSLAPVGLTSAASAPLRPEREEWP